MTRSWHLGAALLALTVVAYLPVWNNEFIEYDDEPCITQNPNVSEGLTLTGIRWAWTNTDFSQWIPLTWMSLQFDAQFFSTHSPEGHTTLSPNAFHAENLFWHACTVLLLFTLWRRLTQALWSSFLVAALFAVHPMHVESVAWAIERKDVLMAFFGLLTLWAYVRYVKQPGLGRYALMTALFSLSLLAKPMLVTLPLALLLFDYWPLRRLKFGTDAAETIGTPLPWKQLLLEKLPLLATGLAIAAVTLNSSGGVSFIELSLSARVMNALTAYGWYLYATLWPAELGILYPHAYGNWSWIRALAGAGVLLAITFLGLWQARRRPWIIVGWLWFVGTIVPVIGLTQIGAQAWADRFCYWPHIGLFTAIVWSVNDLAQRRRSIGFVLATVWIVVLGCLVMQTWTQIRYWRDSVTLWEHTLAITESNDRAHQHLSICYRRQGRIAEAEEQNLKAVRIQSTRRGK